MIYTLVEGHGEVEAIRNLLYRLWTDLNLPFENFFTPKRWPKIDTDKGLERGCKLARTFKDCSGLLILKDEDDICPIEIVPKKIEILKKQNLPFPVGYVLLYREYETLLLASIDSLKGKK